MPFARTTDPDTSHEAARSVDNLSRTQEAILSLFKGAPMNDTSIIARYRHSVAAGDFPEASESGIRSRRAELVQMGKLQDSGLRIKLPSGRSSIMWERTND